MARGGPSQAQRRRDDDDDDDDDVGESMTATQAVKKSGLSDKDIQEKAAQLVRFALFNEYKRKPMKKPDMLKEFLPKGSVAFNAIFELAQKQLRSVFGMEIVELRGKYTDGEKKGKGKQNEEAESDGEGGPRASGPKEPPGTKTWVLRSVLPTQLLASMSHPRPLPAFNAAARPVNQDGPQDSGALLNWEKGDGAGSGHIALLGIRTIILSLVMVMGRVIEDENLHVLLKKLNLTRDTILPYQSPDHKEPPMTLDRYLDVLARQGYLEKIKVLNPSGNLEDAPKFIWRWGPREVEFSEVATGKFIESIFEDGAESDDEDEPDNSRARNQKARRDRMAERESKKQKLVKDIQSAAGGPLTGNVDR